MTRADKLVALWRSFPALADHAMHVEGARAGQRLEPSVDNLEALDVYGAKFAGSGGRAAVAFLLNVWNPGRGWWVGRFDVFEALRVWDEHQHAAFIAYCKEPF